MKFPEIEVSRIREHLNQLSKIGCLGNSADAGFLRAAWSDEESEAHGYVRQYAESNGLTSHIDAVGNLFLRVQGASEEVVQVGSHLDTVPRGGLYDGGAGIVAGLEAVVSLKRAGLQTKRSLELVIWRGEESATFKQVCMGSQAAFGLLSPDVLDRQFQGIALRDAIKNQGFDTSPIENWSATLAPSDIDNIAAHFELHIEQARKLELDNLDIGVVNSIRGAIRRRVIVNGAADHSGGTPMGSEYRKDANLAMAYMQVELDKLGKDYRAAGKDIVQTVGIVNSDKDFNRENPLVYENAQTKISPFGYFSLDVRSNDARFLRSYISEIENKIQEVADELNVDVTIEQISALMPIEELSSDLTCYSVSACEALGLRHTVLPSGALHDVAVVAAQRRSDGSQIPCGLLFIPCRDGISHNPLEFATDEAVTNGSRVLQRALYEAANSE